MRSSKSSLSESESVSADGCLTTRTGGGAGGGGGGGDTSLLGLTRLSAYTGGGLLPLFGFRLNPDAADDEDAASGSRTVPPGQNSDGTQPLENALE
jgi:hypothetical protein